MSTMKSFLEKLLFLIVLKWNFEGTAGVADNATYYIKNEQDALCLTAGPISDSRLSFRKTGNLTLSNCSRNNSQNQQWIAKFSTPQVIYLPDIQFQPFYSKYLNKQLNATVRGQFVKYFPNPVKLMPNKSNNSRYMMYDRTVKRCYKNIEKSHTVKLSKCKREDKAQWWKLILVDEKFAPGTICSSFWSCNH